MRLARVLLVVSFVGGAVAQAQPYCPPGGGCNGSSIDVRCCGAVCDGTTGPRPAPCDATTDDTCAINRALDAVGAAGGGEVIIPPGTCMIAPNTNTFLHLYSNLTIRGTGPKSVIRVAPNTGQYFSVFSPPIGTSLNNVTIKDFTIDQGANTNDPVSNSCTPSCGQYAIWGWSSADLFTPVSHRITISGMRFDQATGENTITLGANGELDATIINNYINFVNHHLPAENQHDNSAIYLEGSQQVVTGNTFFSTLPQFANMTLETHGGRSTISNNTSVNYGGLVNVVATRGDLVELVPNNIVISDNSVICGEAVIQLWAAGLRLRNVAITGNTIQLCNQQRLGLYEVGASSLATGVLFVPVPGSFENILIENNIITHEVDDQADYDIWGTALNAILVQNYINLNQTYIPSNLTNIVIRKNVIKDAPHGGIRIDAMPDSRAPVGQQNAATNVRVSDNIISDAGRNQHNQTLANAAISVAHLARNVYIERNMISDTGSPTRANGLYSLCLTPEAVPQQPGSIRTSQNTVRVAVSPGSPGALKSCRPSAPFAASLLADVSGSKDLLISTIAGGPGASLGVDFMSFTQYLTTINTSDGALIVSAPTADAAGAQWTVGQQVTFRFLCAVGQGCTVTFAAPYSNSGPLVIGSGQGRAITFQAENWPATGVNRYFFELYRGPAVNSQ